MLEVIEPCFTKVKMTYQSNQHFQQYRPTKLKFFAPIAYDASVIRAEEIAII